MAAQSCFPLGIPDCRNLPVSNTPQSPGALHGTRGDWREEARRRYLLALEPVAPEVVLGPDSTDQDFPGTL